MQANGPFLAASAAQLLLLVTSFQKLSASDMLRQYRCLYMLCRDRQQQRQSQPEGSHSVQLPRGRGQQQRPRSSLPRAVCTQGLELQCVI